eukprot:gene6087-7585_t
MTELILEEGDKNNNTTTTTTTTTTTSTTTKIIERPKLTHDEILNKFYKNILTWDVSNLKTNTKHLKKVKVSFEDENDYIKTFEPLLLEECRAQLERSIEEGEKDDKSEPCIGRVRYISESGEFLSVGLVMNNESDSFFFHDNDLMMISIHHPLIVFGMDENQEETDDEAVGGGNTGTTTPPVGEDPNTVANADEKKKRKVIPPSKTPLTEQNRYLHLIGTVEHLESGGIKVKFYLSSIGDRAKQIGILLRYEMDWWITKLCNLSTLQREYSALYLTSQTNFMKTLLLCDEEESGHIMTIPPALNDQFGQSYNPSQFGALKAALDGKNITLIQGPPGTGKTHVILGLISVLLHSTIVPKHPPKEKIELITNELDDYEKLQNWEISQPWLKNGFQHIRDDFTLIDYSFEEREERRKRELWRKQRETGSIKGPQKKRRILLCAPSNGAVDEIVSRLIRDGLLNAEGKKYTPSLVRVGPGSHVDVESVSLEYMVRCRQQVMNSNTAIPSSTAATAASTSISGRSTQDTNSIRSIILDEADIVATTLSFSGSSLLNKMGGGFDIVIIDEAAQAVETSTLIPIQHQCKKIVLVGDPKQLPATIISSVAIKYSYDQSLFQRLQEKNTPHMLTTQYRMHSTIRSFPSKHFYNDLLEDGPNIPSRSTQYHSNPFFGPMVFYDLSFSVETKPGGGSVNNEDECKMAFLLYQLILKSQPDEDFSGRIGIISPYRQQVLTMREYFKNYPGISIDTVDGFQGREREIIIFSCVRAPPEKGAGIGFLADVRRMNVALTRPRSSLLILGNSRALSVNPDWNELIRHCKENKTLIPVTQPLDTTISTYTSKELFDKLSEEGFLQHLDAPLTAEELEARKLAEEKKKKRLKRRADIKARKEQQQQKKKQKTKDATSTTTPTTTDTNTTTDSVEVQPAKETTKEKTKETTKETNEPQKETTTTTKRTKTSSTKKA